MRCKISILLLCAALLCGGCMGSQEIDELSFILTIGVDQAEDSPGEYIYTFRVAMPRAFTGEGGGEDKDKTKLVSVKAPALGAAVRQLGIAMNRNVELSHVSALFVHEKVARDGLFELVPLFIRSKVYRNTMVVLVTKEAAKESMEKNTSPFELFQYRWVDSVKRTQKFAAAYMMADLRNFYVAMAEPQAAIATGYGTVIEKSLDKKAAPPLPAQMTPQYSAEDFPREGGTELIVVGSAIFRDWKMVGNLNTVESRGANILKEGVETIFSIPDPIEEGEQVTVGVQIARPKIEAAVKDGKLQIKVKAKVLTELSDSSGGENYFYAENREKLERQISENVRSSILAYFRATQPLGADCIQISNRCRHNVYTWEAWADEDWAALYKNAQVEVEADTSLQRSGLIWRYAKGESL